MAIGTTAAIALGAGALAAGGLQFAGARGQQKAAERASSRAASQGRVGSQLIGAAGSQGRADIQAGEQRAQDLLAQGTRALGRQKEDVEDIFAQERAVGSESLAQLQELLLGGGEGFSERLAEDPGFQFRLGEGNKAIERAARAGGSFGGGANLKDFARFSQGLASQEADKIVGRLMGLAGIGSQAGRSEAAFGSQLAQSIAGSFGQRGSLAASTGSNLANLGLESRTRQANALLGGVSQSNQLDLQASNARAQQFGAAGNTVMQLATLGALAGGGGGGGEEFRL